MPAPYSIIDLHEDLLLHIQRRDLYPDHWQTNFAMLERCNVRVTVATAFPVPPQENYFDPVSNDMIEADFRTYGEHCQNNDRWTIIRAKADVQRCLAAGGPHGLLLHIEGLNVVSPDDWSRLEAWHAMGWRSLGMVWNTTNPLGGGTQDTDPMSGLTAFGAEMLAWLQERHMIVDFAHMNAPTFADALRRVRGPIVVSHGNAAACCPNPRNYTDDQLRQVAASGGVVGVFFAKTYVTGRDRPASIDDVVRHVEHLRRVMGIDHVALGTDFGGIITGHVSGLDSLDRMPDFWAALARAGYTDDMCERIAFRNAARVLTGILE